MLYIVNMVKFIFSLTKLGTLAPRSTLYLPKKQYLSNGAEHKLVLRTDKSQCGI